MSTHHPSLPEITAKATAQNPLADQRKTLESKRKDPEDNKSSLTVTSGFVVCCFTPLIVLAIS